MPEVCYETRVAASVGRVWEFVKDMDNWAPLLTGYRGHEVQSEKSSVWTLQGDVGVLSRTVQLEVNITEWLGEERVSFTLKGLNELVEGDGTFSMSEASALPGAEAAEPSPERPEGLWRRFLRGLFNLLFRWRHGRVQRGASAVDGGAVGSRLSFRLRMEAGGPTAPMVNAMLGPAMGPAAEELANRIAAHLESGARALSPAHVAQVEGS